MTAVRPEDRRPMSAVRAAGVTTALLAALSLAALVAPALLPPVAGRVLPLLTASLLALLLLAAAATLHVAPAGRGTVLAGIALGAVLLGPLLTAGLALVDTAALVLLDEGVASSFVATGWVLDPVVHALLLIAAGGLGVTLAVLGPRPPADASHRTHPAHPTHPDATVNAAYTGRAVRATTPRPLSRALSALAVALLLLAAVTLPGLRLLFDLSDSATLTSPIGELVCRAVLLVTLIVATVAVAALARRATGLALATCAVVLVLLAILTGAQSVTVARGFASAAFGYPGPGLYPDPLLTWLRAGALVLAAGALAAGAAADRLSGRPRPSAPSVRSSPSSPSVRSGPSDPSAAPSPPHGRPAPGATAADRDRPGADPRG